MACDLVGARKVLIITTATNRFNFARDVREWQQIERSVAVCDPRADVCVVPWSLIARRVSPLMRAVEALRWDVLIVDESHYAKSVGAQRTHAAFALAGHAEKVWLLSGTPCANSPLDLYPALHALERDRLRPDVDGFLRFQRRYCVTRPQFVGGRRIDVVVGGKNEDELRARLDGWWLRRTQEDVGIRPPVYDTLLLPPAHVDRKALDADQAEVLAAAETDDTRSLDMHLGTLRRLTGSIKAAAVGDVVVEEFESGLDCIVLMCWHQDTVRALAERLQRYGVVTLTGASSPREREAAQVDFREGRANVFIGQILAAGEAIDLSRSAELIFVEPSFVPKDMAQAALRITNHSQTRNCRVRVAALEGSIDEAVTKILVRKVASITKVLGKKEIAA